MLTFSDLNKIDQETRQCNKLFTLIHFYTVRANISAEVKILKLIIYESQTTYLKIPDGMASF